MPPGIITREFRTQDYDAAVRLWDRVEGVEIAEGDSLEDLQTYLSRNPGLSRVAVHDGEMLGVALCGHDGRRGFIYHVAVDPTYQNRGIARQLVAECLEALGKLDIKRALILVAEDNELGHAFWLRSGWEEVPGVKVMGIDIPR